MYTYNLTEDERNIIQLSPPVNVEQLRIMPLFQILVLDNHNSIIRVPNGWIYQSVHVDSDTTTRSNSTFIPLTGTVL